MSESSQGYEENLKAVQQMQDYIEGHLYEPITLKQLAKSAGYSPWHAARIFKEFTEKPPIEYIRRRRLSKAAVDLRDRPGKIIDVAMDFVFDSHEGFTRAFAREFGMSPRQYRKRTPPIPLFLPYRAHDVNQEGAVDMKDVQSSKAIFVQVVERPKRKALVKRGVKAGEYFAYCAEVGCGVWGILESVKEAIYEPVGMWLPDSMIPPGTSKYVQGVELPLDYTNAVPEGFELMELPPCTMMIFQGEPYEDVGNNFETAIMEVGALIKRFHPEIYGYKFEEGKNPRMQLAPMGYRGYIELWPVVPVNK